MTTGTAYCTVLASNYLPKALALAESLDRHHPGSTLHVLLIDVADDAARPDLAGVRVLSTEVLGLDKREVLHLATSYNLVEFATAVKPLFFRALLADHEQVAYLDPDTYVVAPMTELPVDLEATEGGILLTPHFLEPVAADGFLSEGHLLTVGFYNLGFCAVDRRALRFLDWWWNHLRTECIWDPLSGLFVDQKWLDIGAPLFRAGTWRHAGYNVSVANLHERPIDLGSDGYVITSTGDPLRLFHFHAFDPSNPEELSTRFGRSTAHLRDVVGDLAKEYAERLRHFDAQLPLPPPYPYSKDTTGRVISRHLRRAYRETGGHELGKLPSPFLAEDADRWRSWRRSARKSAARGVVGDVAKGSRLIFPDEYGRLRKRFPALTKGMKSRLVRESGIWG
jgi:hypothetical protein